jgi:hypothetical protein
MNWRLAHARRFEELVDLCGRQPAGKADLPAISRVDDFHAAIHDGMSGAKRAPLLVRRRSTCRR